MTTLYLLMLFGICKPTVPLITTDEPSWVCISSGTASVSYSFGITPEQAQREVANKKPNEYALFAGSCSAEIRQMSNLCMGDCTYTHKVCSFAPAQVSTRTVVVTEILGQ